MSKKTIDTVSEKINEDNSLPSAIAQMKTIKEVHEYYQKIISCMPNNVFWLDKNCITQGCNANVLKFVGLEKQEEFVGITYEKMGEIAGWIQGHAQIYEHDDREVMVSKKPKLNKEDPPIINSDGTLTYYSSSRVPLFDNEHKEVIGVVGISIDITEQKKLLVELQQAKEAAEEANKAKKESELLEIENAARKEQLKIQEKFTKMANQVAHDIRSPLASLLMIVKACEAIPEKERIALRSASNRISDIANNLLHQYRSEQSGSSIDVEEKKPILLSATLLQLLTEKKFQYQDSPITFDCQFDTSGQFAFISIEPSPFKRMISNLINNAVEAFSGQTGLVTLKINATNEWSNIIISDNGKGMPPALVEKIMNNMAVSEGKIDGNGIGLTQARETLANNNGTLSIHSTIGMGTDIQLQFPRIKAPAWVAEELILSKQNIIVILDDDHSIHSAWDSQFSQFLKEAPDMTLHHFEMGQEALTFLHTLSNDDKKRTLLLTDYELLNQGINGLDVVEHAHVTHAILVTSHYENPDIQKRAVQLNCKILPKQLASEIQISFSNTEEKMTPHVEQGHGAEFVHAILVDDDVEFAENVICYSFDSSDVIVHFKNPDELKENLEQYPEKYLKSTKICLDNNFDTSHVKGVQVAQELHEKGYTQLYLISGDTFLTGELPKYITVLSKGDMIQIKDW